MADIETIVKLREIRNEIQENLKDINISDYSGSYGQEQESSSKGIKVGVQNILHDITGLTESPTKFIQKSSHLERNDLIQKLKNIRTSVSDRNFAVLAQHIDSISLF